MRVKVLIGRFQPFHSEHKRLIDSAMIGANKIIIIIGSANQPRSIKNPWTFQERKNMILACYPYGDKLVIEPLRDISYNDQQWAAGVQKIVNQNTSELDIIELIGHEKDETSFYLRMFPQWSRIDHKMDDSVSATSVRDLYFSGASPKLYSGALPNTTNAALSLFRAGEDYLKLAREYEHIKKYKKSWLAAPYAPTFVTSDAVVVQSGHVLMVVRGAAPGEGLLALPGGFVNQAERIEDGMLRELREETRLKVPAPVLKGSIVNRYVFDHPTRSLRGRTITHAFLIRLPDGKLPPVKGGDDAAKAMWIPIADLNPEEIFEDHFDIITYLLGGV